MARTQRLASIDDRRLDVFSRLTNHQLRNRLDEKNAVLVAESRTVVEVALECGVEPLAFLVDERDLAASEDVLGRAGDDVPAYVLPHEEVARLTGFRLTRGLLCAMRRPELPSVADVAASSRSVVVLEDLVDVSNVGAVFRNAAALGADAVVVSPHCADPFARRAVRVSMGCVLKLPWARAEEGQWPGGALDELGRAGFSTLALALAPGSVPLGDVPPRVAGERRALLFGSEGYGLAPGTLARCDRSVVIPMARGVDSLNVAASSAVALWQLLR